MKLDKRIIDGKKPLTCFDIEEAREFEGKEGYFCDYPRAFAYGDDPLEKCATTGILELDVDRDYSHCPYINKTTCANYPYFLPAAWLKPEEPEKKYRPFSLNEFLERYKMGNTVTFRLKKGEYVPEAESLVEYQRMITGYEGLPEDRDKPGKGSILLGGCPPVSLARLFEFYELDNDFNWQPFGILEEE